MGMDAEGLLSEKDLSQYNPIVSQVLTRNHEVVEGDLIIPADNLREIHLQFTEIRGSLRIVPGNMDLYLVDLRGTQAEEISIIGVSVASLLFFGLRCQKMTIDHNCHRLIGQDHASILGGITIITSHSPSS